MPEAPTFHDESLMPLTMGSPYRVPYHAYPNWGLIYTGEEQALAAYKAEWGLGDQQQMAQIEQATKKAGLGDYPGQLRRATAEVVHDIIARRHEVGNSRVFLDIGSGPGLSTLQVYQHLPADARDRSQMWLLDPSSKSLDAAMDRMNQNGVKKYELFEGTDSEVLPSIKEGAVNIIMAVASVHHHSKIPFDQHFRVLTPAGIAVYADWHQPVWEHPGSVLRFLEDFTEEEWPNREEGLQHWQEVYPQSKEVLPISNNPPDLIAIEGIRRFWRAYAEIVRGQGVINELWPLEGHRPVQKYVEGLEEAGFVVGPPLSILGDSSLLQLTVAQRPK